MASNKIKGITIEIGGDTTKLGKAIEAAEGKSRSLQGELKHVERLLKMDPGNVELLTQKQQLLSEAIEQTKDKLQTLKDAEKQLEEQAARGEIGEDQMRSFKREVEATEQQLKALEEQADKSSVALTRIGEAGEKIKNAGDKIENVGKKASVISGAVAGIGVAGGTLAINFEDSMAKVSTIADTSQVPLEELRTAIVNLSDQTGISANQIAEDVYNAISAGQATGDAVAFVEQATKLAKAGFTDTGSALDILSTIMNAYGLEAEKTAQVSDYLIQTQNLGKTTVAELSSSMGKIIPTANAYGVQLDQLCAGYAIMTANGVDTAESTTYMNAMLNELGKAGTGVSDTLKEKTGKSFKELTDGGMSLSAILAIIEESAKENELAFSDMWSSSEAAKAGLILLGDDANNFNERLHQMRSGAGSTNEAFGKMQTTSDKMRIATNELKNGLMDLGIELMEVLMPAISGIVEAIHEAVLWFKGLDDGTKNTIITIGLVVAALGPVIVMIGKVISVIGTVMTYAPMIKTAIMAIKGAFAGLNAVMLANPIGLIIAAVAALVAAFIYLWNNCEAFREFWINLWNTVKEFCVNAWQEIKIFFSETVPAIIGNVVEWFKALPGRMWEALKNAVEKVTQWGSDMKRKAVEAATNTFNAIVKKIKELPGEMLSIGKDIVKGLWNGIGNMTDWIISKVKGFGGSVISGLKSFFGIQSPSKVMRDEIGRYLSEGIGIGITENADAPIDAIKDLKKDMFDISDIGPETIERNINATFNRKTTKWEGETVIRQLFTELQAMNGALSDKMIKALEQMKLVADTGEVLGWIAPELDKKLDEYRKLAERGAV